MEAPSPTALVRWLAAPKAFLDTLSSPRMVQAYQRALTKVMGADWVAGLTLPTLADYRAGLVACVDATVRIGQVHPQSA